MDKALEGDSMAAARKGRAVFRVVIAGSQQAIFEEITATSRPLPAIFNSRMHTTGLRPGGRLQMRTVSGGHVIVEGDILEYDPPRRFVHTHRFTRHSDPACRVSYELRLVEGGVEVTLTVDDLPIGTGTANEMRRGGGFILGNLKAIVETGRATLMARVLYRVFGAMEFVLPARTRSEHWPLERKEKP